MLASFRYPSPNSMIPSTATFPPVLTSSRVSSFTSSASISSGSAVWLSNLHAVAGTISVSIRMALRVFCNVRCSRYVPNWKRNVTIAASLYSPINSAPNTAMLTKTSMPMAFILSPVIARKKIGNPASTVATR